MIFVIITISFYIYHSTSMIKLKKCAIQNVRSFCASWWAQAKGCDKIHDTRISCAFRYCLFPCTVFTKTVPNIMNNILKIRIEENAVTWRYIDYFCTKSLNCGLGINSWMHSANSNVMFAYIRDLGNYWIWNANTINWFIRKLVNE